MRLRGYTSGVVRDREQLISRLAAALEGAPVVLAALFGSWARGSAQPGRSDVDVAILGADAGLGLRGEAELAAALSAAVGATVDLVRLEDASTLLRFRVARDGVLLVERQPGAWVAYRATAASEHADFAEALAPHAERYRQRQAGMR
jgi:predicted nucleotidyltransferase